jgi:hypothetical protein
MAASARQMPIPASAGADVPLGHRGYAFLARAEVLGVVEGLRDDALPMTRQQIAGWLVIADRDSAGRLSPTDRSELSRLLAEFKPEAEIAGGRTDAKVRRIVDRSDSTWRIAVEPVVVLTATSDQRTVKGQAGYTADGGLAIFGRINSNIAFGVVAANRSVQGRTVDFGNLRGPEPSRGGWRVVGDSDRVVYETVEAQAAFRTSWLLGAVGIGRHSWGPSQFANLFLSEKAPPYPYLRLQTALDSWLTVTFIHAQLNSDMVDSAVYQHRADTNPDGDVDRRRWMSAHRFSATIAKGVDLAFQESVIYGDRSPDWFYLVPVAFFWTGQHQGDNTDNYQMGFDIDIYRWPGWRVYGAWYLEEWTPEAVFGDDEHNWFAFQAGVSVFDMLGAMSNLDFTAEYTRLNPTVYAHRQPINDRLSTGAPLGHWLGRNGDQWLWYLRYQPRSPIVITTTLRRIRKGGEPDASDFYLRPDYPFLSEDDGPIVKVWDCDIRGTYEVWPNALLFAGGWWRRQSDGLGVTTTRTAVYGGIRAGIWR